MLRFFVILASVLLLVGMPAELAPAALLELAAEASDDCHCCPDGDDEEGDCCDWDFGACCATGMAAALPSAQAQHAEHTSALPESRTSTPVHLLRPRDNGPPPTPPPIG